MIEQEESIMLNQALIDQEYGFLKDVAYLDISLTALPPMRVQTAWKKFLDGYIETYGVNAPPISRIF